MAHMRSAINHKKVFLLLLQMAGTRFFTCLTHTASVKTLIQRYVKISEAFFISLYNPHPIAKNCFYEHFTVQDSTITLLTISAKMKTKKQY